MAITSAVTVTVREVLCWEEGEKRRKAAITLYLPKVGTVFEQAGAISLSLKQLYK